MTTETKTLRIRADTLRLSEADPVALRFPPEFGRIHIEADTVYVDGWMQWFGREVTILARRIVANPVDGRMAVIDVSGAPAEPSFDPAAPSSRRKGTPKAPNGLAGQDGGAGQPGGRLSMVVDWIDGELGLAANGSKGGDSERGSDGVKPAKPDGRDARLDKGKRPTKGPYGGRVLAPWKKFSADSYIVVAYGERGGDARRGGAAGAPGRPGQGGDGGHLRVSYTGPTRPPLQTTAAGGAAGQAGDPAAAGPAGQPGIGGRNWVLVVDWLHKWHQNYAGVGKDGWVNDAVKKYKVAPRARSGKAGAAAGTVPPQPQAADGAAGRVDTTPADQAALARAVDLSFLTFAWAHAQRVQEANAPADALPRYRWLSRLAEARAKSDAAAADIARAAQAAIQALTPTPAAAASARRTSSRRSVG